MSDILSRLLHPEGSRKSEKRIGRGQGSGLGTTCGRGQKGQKSRKPGNIRKLGFQGGQTPMQRRLPKRGFNLPFPIETVAINVSNLEAAFPAGAQVDADALRAAGLVLKRKVRMRIVGDGELKKKLSVSAHGFSKTAAAKIEKAGGSVTIIPWVPEKKPEKA
jgi:large subunit ribosomal protein L15